MNQLTVIILCACCGYCHILGLTIIDHLEALTHLLNLLFINAAAKAVALQVWSTMHLEKVRTAIDFGSTLDLSFTFHDGVQIFGQLQLYHPT